MKRIGVVSRIHGINYGANLQAVALQTILIRFGACVEYINWEVEIPLSQFQQIRSKIFGIVRMFLGYKQRLYNTTLFQKRYLHISKIVNNGEDLETLIKTYDVLLAGSDQIWNPRYLMLSNNFYLLPFDTKQLFFSYASSFGVDAIPQKLQNRYYKYLSSFKTVSVREITGKHILENIGILSRVDIDPTLLMDEETWLGFFETKPIISGEYICCYVMNGASTLNNYIIKQAQKMKRMLNVPKIVIVGEKEYKGFFSQHIYFKTAGPSEFLNILYNSKYVLTSSFHGTCFSILFKKNFYSILEKNNNLNSRILDLLSQLKLSDRILYRGDYKKISIDSINYFPSYHILEQMRTRSLAYLKEIVDCQD